MYSSAIEMELFANLEQVGEHEFWRGRCLLKLNPVIMVGKDLRAVSYVYWEINEGKRIPPGHYLRRTCEFRICINPNHRELIRKGEDEEGRREEASRISIPGLQG